MSGELVRICCGDGFEWEEVPKDREHAFALLREYGRDCGCETPETHYVEVAQPVQWVRVGATTDPS